MHGQKNYYIVIKTFKNKMEEYHIRLSDELRSFMQTNLRYLEVIRTTNTNELWLQHNRVQSYDLSDYIITYDDSDEKIMCVPYNRLFLFDNIDRTELMQFHITNYKEEISADKIYELRTHCIKEVINYQGFVHEEYIPAEGTIEAKTYSRDKCDMVSESLKRYHTYEKATAHALYWEYFFRYYGSKTPSTVVKAYIDDNENICIEERDYETNELLYESEPIQSDNPGADLYKVYYKYMVRKGYINQTEKEESIKAPIKH